MRDRDVDHVPASETSPEIPRLGRRYHDSFRDSWNIYSGDDDAEDRLRAYGPRDWIINSGKLLSDRHDVAFVPCCDVITDIAQ